jgi:hypothetical protein
MAFTDKWDSTFESLPDNNTYGYLIDDFFRRLYIAIRERMQVDHIWEDDQNDGQHQQLTMVALASTPSPVAGYGFFYTQDVGAGVIELFYEDAAGNVLQISDAGNFVKNSQVLPYAASVSGTDTYAISTVPTFAAYVEGMIFTFKADIFNIGACSLNVNGKGAINIKKCGSKALALATGDIHTGQMVTVIYDGANFQLMNDPGEPVGSSKIWHTETPPAGYLHRNGASVLRADYPELFSVIGVLYGNVDGTHFNLPGSPGTFDRAWDNSAGVDPDAATRTDRGDGTIGDHVGTKQSEDLKAHVHAQTIGQNVAGGAGTHYIGSYTGVPDGIDNTASFGGNETRPVNINVMYIIKV